MRPTILTLILSGLVLQACNKSDFKGSAAIITPTITKEFTQDEYPLATSSYTQGHRGDPQDENFEQGEWGKLDILVVIDNSGSMTEEQSNLSSKLEPLLSKVERADWQISVVTTDPSDGCQRALIKKTDTNAKAKFQAAVQAGTQGSGLERGIYQAVAGLSGYCKNWVRSDSTLAVLIVSDEDNCHIDENQHYGCVGQADLDGAYLTDFLSTIRTPGKDAKVYGLLWHPTQDQSQCKTALKSGDTYAKVIDATGGVWGSICDSDYTNTLTAISEDVSQILNNDFDLAHAPDDGTLVITVDGSTWDKFTLEGTKVHFTETPPFGSKVVVSYRHGKEGELADAFPLDKIPVAESIYVEVGGTKLAPGTYRWDDQLKKVVFDAAPDERSEVKFTYKERVTLNNVYDIGTKVDARTLIVTVNDEVAKDTTYDAATGKLTINPAPEELAKIKISFKEVRSAK